jgi:hypothetical protein
MLKNARRDGPTILSKLILPKFKVGAQKQKQKQNEREKCRRQSKLRDCVMLLYFYFYFYFIYREMDGASLFNQILFIYLFIY